MQYHCWDINRNWSSSQERFLCHSLYLQLRISYKILHSVRLRLEVVLHHRERFDRYSYFLWIRSIAKSKIICDFAKVGLLCINAKIACHLYYLNFFEQNVNWVPYKAILLGIRDSVFGTDTIRTIQNRIINFLRT